MESFPVSQMDSLQINMLGLAFDHHLALLAMLAGEVPGQIYLDQLEQPKICLAAAGRRMFLKDFNQNQPEFSYLKQVFTSELNARAQAGTGVDSFELHFTQPGWLNNLLEYLNDFNPLVGQRVYYEFSFESPTAPAAFPPGYEIRLVDRDLLADQSLLRREELEEEMCSERPSLKEFLGKSFGLCLVFENKVSGWCLSEYNLGSRCEVGIAVHHEHRKQGLGTNLTRAFLHLAQKKGINRVGWHSWKNNQASIATARRSDFRLIAEEAVLYGWFDPVIHHAIGGNIHFAAGKHNLAAEWYTQAFGLGAAPDWAYWNAAVNYMKLQQIPEAFDHIRQAVDHGFHDLEHIQNSHHFKSLHGTPIWEELLADLQTRINLPDSTSLTPN